MSPVSDAAIEQVRLASDIIEVVQAYVPLKRAGATFRALCPFHQEKTPSFHVNPQRQFFHCFGCGAGGDVFTFVMTIEKADFMTALRLLAKRAGISLAQDPAEATREANKDLLFELNQQVAAFYHDLLLTSPEAAPARAYLKGRGFTSQVAKEFLIGFAPDRWDTLARWAGRRVPPEQFIAAGLLVRPSEERRATGGASSPYDRFRNRLMFPIHDEMGRVAGFSGRILADEPGAAKYVNSPETPVFHKSRLLYGLFRARRALAERREAVICEGQIDVIRCQLAGFTTAVAAQGTAFTPDHARVIKRYADGVVLAFDADAPGQKAALRTTEVFLQAELAVRVAVMPSGEDPDSLILKQGPDAFQRVLDAALSSVDFHVHHLAGREDLSSEVGLMRAAAELADMIGRVPNPVQQTLFLRQAAEKLRLPEAALQRELDKRRAASRPVAPAPPAAPARRPIRELALAEHLLADTALAEWVKTYLPLDAVTDPDCRALVQAAIRAWEQGRDIFAVLAEADPDRSGLGQFAAQLLAAPLKTRGAGATQEESVRDLILSLRAAVLSERSRRLRHELAAREAAGPDAEPAARRLRTELIEIGYDLAKLKKWETALPLITPPPAAT